MFVDSVRSIYGGFCCEWDEEELSSQSVLRQQSGILTYIAQGTHIVEFFKYNRSTDENGAGRCQLRRVALLVEKTVVDTDHVFPHSSRYWGLVKLLYMNLYSCQQTDTCKVFDPTFRFPDTAPLHAIWQ